MDYDVIILGGGIVGCAVAYELSKYSLNIALIEKEYDIADDVAMVNSAIIYDGFECEDNLMSKLEFMGNNMFDEIANKFNIPFQRNGALLIAEDEASEKKIDDMYLLAQKRGLEYIELLKDEEIYKVEPNIEKKVRGALYSSKVGVISPYDLAISYGEVAFDNGVNFRLGEEVLDIQKISRAIKVVTNKNKFTCRMVVNTTAGMYSGIDDSNELTYTNQGFLNYLLLDEGYNNNLSKTVFSYSGNDKNIYSYKTLDNKTICAVTANSNLNYEETLSKVASLLKNVNINIVDSFYQTEFNNGSIIIDDSYISKGYMKVTGKHYGQVSMTPFIAKMICDTIIGNISCKLKKDYNDKRREVYKFKDLSFEERKKVLKMDKRYGKMICLCNEVTEGEIVDAIRRPLGARTVEGIKRRTGVTSGNCKGAYCTNKIVSILAREINKQMTDIVKDSKNSNILVSRIKEFDNI
jgi:Predicted dehydrogenase